MNAQRIVEIKYNALCLIVKELSHDKITGVSLSRLYNKTFNDTVDYHEFSYLLDELSIKGIVLLTGHNNSGMCEYKLNS